MSVFITASTEVLKSEERIIKEAIADARNIPGVEPEMLLNSEKNLKTIQQILKERS